MNILQPATSPRTQRQSKSTLIAQEFELREKYHDALSRLSDCVAQRSKMRDALKWIVEHEREFDGIEDAPKMLFEISTKASAALRGCA